MASSRSRSTLTKEEIEKLREQAMQHYKERAGKPLNKKAKADLELLKQAKRVQ